MGLFSEPRDADAVQVFCAEMMAQPAHVFFGLELILAAGGRSRVEFTAGEHALVPGGYVHGGVISLLLEPTAMFALVTQLPLDSHAVTAASDYKFLRPVPAGSRAVLEANVVRLGRMLAHCDARLCVDDRVCAEARYVKSIISV